MEKQNYVREQLDHDYVSKSKNSALAFIFVSILFFFLNKLDGDFRIYTAIFTVVVIGISIVRLMNVNNYLNNKVSTKEAAYIVSATALANAFVWGAIGVLSVLALDRDNFQLLVTFVILIAFSAGSIVTISHKKYIFIFLNYFVLFPQAFYSIYGYVKTDDVHMLWLVVYTIINLTYNFRQGKVVHQELIKRFSIEFDLKKSLEEVALSKKNLEEESMKTFHASRLSSLGEMAGGVAHEINNPLTIILATTKSILNKEELHLDDHTKNKLQKIGAACERISKIVKSMKIISSKNDQIEHEIFKVSKVLDLSLSFFEERFKNESVDFQLENNTDPLVKCNPLQISQILINLISNALDALQSFEAEKRILIKISEDIAHKSVDIRVINSGPLIKTEVAEKIFEPFFSTKVMGKGTGLGLSISQTLANGNHAILNYEAYQEQVCFKLHMNTYEA